MYPKMVKKNKNKILKFSKEIRKVDWKSCFIGIILSVLILLTFNLIILPEVNKTWDRQLQDAINACPYSPEEYQINVFDCSNMANMLDDWLEQKYGYETYIVVWRSVDGVSGHAMVIANGRFIEPTTKMIVYTFRTELYADLSTSVTIIDDAERLPNYSLEEWGYPKRW